ncbi:MAG: hypothetical protein Q7S65_00210 [Nanoarchaeota archaeon]|nr:hypothetical protein [Nanoarchaeota archaeon]
MVHIGGKTVVWLADPDPALASRGNYLDQMAGRVRFLDHSHGDIDYVVLLEEAREGPLSRLLASDNQGQQQFQKALGKWRIDALVKTIYSASVRETQEELSPSQVHCMRRMISDHYRDAIFADILPLSQKEKEYHIRAMVAYALERPPRE